jgi:hypothetical protein
LALLFTKRSMIDLTLLSWLCIHYVAGAIILRW